MDMCVIVLVDILVLIVNKVSLYDTMYTVLHYLYIVVVIYILPEITQPPRNTSGNLYSTVNLTCIATGNPIPTILWYKDDVLIPNDNNDLVCQYHKHNLNIYNFIKMVVLLPILLYHHIMEDMILISLFCGLKLTLEYKSS